MDESRRNTRHAQLFARFLAQTLSDSAHGVLRAGIDRHRRCDLNSGRGNDVDEMSETLPAENRQSGSDAVQNTFEIDINHLLPILDAKLIEGGNWCNAGVVDENVELAVPVNCQTHEVG